MLTETERSEFISLFPEVIALIQTHEVFSKLGSIKAALKDSLEYNVPHGKQNRGTFVVMAYKRFAPEMTPEDFKKACALGWVMELLQAFALILDDITDGSVTRRGRPCWYKVKGSLMAIYDGVLIYESAYVLLKHYLGDHPAYPEMLNLLHETVFSSVAGQLQDGMTATEDFASRYNMDFYKEVVRFKTSRYTFCLPIFLAMAMASSYDEDTKARVEHVLVAIGLLFQIQDDYMDCYGDPEVTGKVGTDIEEGKCTWLVVTALERADAEQRTLIEENYGKSDPDNIRRIKELYTELGIQGSFQDLERKSRENILEEISQLPANLPQKLFVDVLRLTSGRKR